MRRNKEGRTGDNKNRYEKLSNFCTYLLILHTVHAMGKYGKTSFGAGKHTLF